MTRPAQSSSKSRKRSQAGSEMVEFAIVFLPLFALTMLMLDVAWAMFAQSAVHSAVRQGARWGVTCRSVSGQTGLNASIRQVVIQNSMGFVTPANALSVVQIQYLDPGTLAHIPAGGASGGNVLQVSVTGLTIASFGPIYRNGNGSVSADAVATDVMEGSAANSCTP